VISHHPAGSVCVAIAIATFLCRSATAASTKSEIVGYMSR